MPFIPHTITNLRGYLCFHDTHDSPLGVESVLDLIRFVVNMSGPVQALSHAPRWPNERIQAMPRRQIVVPVTVRFAAA